MRRTITNWSLLVALSLIGLATPWLFAQDAQPSAVEVYWKHTRTVSLPGASHVEVFEDSVCKAEIATDQVQIIGLTRGETLVFVWAGDQRVTWLVRVVEEPENPHPHFRRADVSEDSTHGQFGSSAQSAAGSDVPSGYVLFHQFQWDEQLDGSRLLVQGQAQDTTAPGVPAFNLNTASAQYLTKNSTLSVLDSVLNVNGSFAAQVVPTSGPSTLMLRGADFDLKRGPNEYEAFAGATLPAYFLNLSSTRDLLGFKFNHIISVEGAGPNSSRRFDFYGTTALADVPFPSLNGVPNRHVTPFQTLGFTARLNKQWAFQVTGGASSHGLMAQGAFSYNAWHRSAFASFTRSSADFPLNQLQLLPAGRSSATAGGSLELTSKVAAAVTYQHTSTEPSLLFAQRGSSDYLNPNFNFVLSSRNHLTFNCIFTRTEGGLKVGDRSTGQREDLVFSSQINPRLGNSAQVTVGALSDPFQLNSQSQFSLRDSVNIRVHSDNTLFVSFSHDRTDPSLVNRLNQEIDLLAPALQQLFLLDPVAFVESPNLPPEIRTLLNNLQPTNTQIALSGQFLAFDHRLNFSPTVGYYHSDQGLTERSNSHLAGYSLSYGFTPTLQLQSSLSNVFVLDSTLHGLRRTTVLTVGFNKSLSAAPRWLLPSRGHRGVIRGRVFRDLNVNGVYDAGKPGLAGIRVELSTGDTALTDAQGRFEFTGLLPDNYGVTLPFSQFKEPVRATNPTSVRVDLSQSRYAEVEFGIVNFSRVSGNVYNDYLLNGDRQPDAPSIRNVRLKLVGAKTTQEVMADASGDYEFGELAPGDYQLSIDPSTVPANFVAPAQAYALRLAPAASVVEDVPLRALRTISGKVLFAPPQHKSASSAGGPQPLAGVRLAVGGAVVTTDSEGNFLLRNLPAGRLTLKVLGPSALPEGLKLPSGEVELPHEPTDIRNATIVISNPELLKYLQPGQDLERKVLND